MLWVLKKEERDFQKFRVDLELWNPSAGCFTSSERPKELWVSFVSLLIPFWGKEILERLGNACGSF